MGQPLSVSRGKQLYEDKNYSQAITFFEDLLAKDPASQKGWYYKGLAHYQLGQYPQALHAFDELLARRSQGDVFRVWFYRGMCCERLGDAHGAIECLEKATEREERYLAAWVEMGKLLFECGSYERCVRCFEKAWEIDSRQLDYWNWKGKAYLKLERVDEALKCFEYVLKRDKGNFSAWLSKGFYYMETKNVVEMERCLGEMVKIAEENRGLQGKVVYFKGCVLMELGKDEEALGCFNQVIEMKESIVRVWHYKGLILERMNRREEAEVCFQKYNSFDKSGSFKQLSTKQVTDKVTTDLKNEHTEKMEGNEGHIETAKLKEEELVPVMDNVIGEGMIKKNEDGELGGVKEGERHRYHYYEPDNTSPFVLGPIIMLREGEKLLSIKEAVKAGLGTEFDEIIWEGYYPTWLDTFQKRKAKYNFSEDITFEEYLSLDYPIELFKLLNKDLTSDKRTEDIKKWKDYLNYLVAALKKIAPFKADPSLFLYRGVNVPLIGKTKYLIGNEIAWYAFSSATTREDKVVNFMKNEKDEVGTLFKIRGCFSGRSILEFSSYPDECEVLFPAGSRFKVVNVVYDQNLIELEQIPTLDRMLRLEEEYIPLKKI
eukprot:TRINITY_DN13299_c0_g1_i1.p1 TRINITY_DN13299_c0_g1~~TRINITY_DN13299_c0_g1_i1.p1  ORF type:complete len:601 (+),score=146.19 TRINITY_DN13299_c0_g1_i1:16-1818(+)